MAFATLELEFDGDVAVLTLNRPDKLNSFTDEMHGELRTAFERVMTADVRAMIITGKGRGFCAGQDLGDPAIDLEVGFDAGRALKENYNPLIMAIHKAPFPVIAAVNGVAAGAGANLALACDIVIAARSASFIQAFAKIGLVPDAGGSWSLVQKIGLARAKGLALLAEPLSAEKAKKWGLIWQVVNDDDLQQTAQDMAHHLAKQPTQALARIKTALHAAAGNSLEAQLVLEQELQAASAKTGDFREGVDAFLEKRKPNFSGN